MADKKIHIPARKVEPNRQGVIRITPEAYSLLAEVVNESGRNVRAVASMIIIQAIKNDLIVYDREEE